MVSVELLVVIVVSQTCSPVGLGGRPTSSVEAALVNCGKRRPAAFGSADRSAARTAAVIMSENGGVEVFRHACRARPDSGPQQTALRQSGNARGTPERSLRLRRTAPTSREPGGYRTHDPRSKSPPRHARTIMF